MSRSFRRLLCVASVAAVAVSLAAASQTAAAQSNAGRTSRPGQVSGGLRASFATPRSYPAAFGDTWFNTVDSRGRILATSNDTAGFGKRCRYRGHIGSDIAINRLTGPPRKFHIRTINCMTDYGPRGGGHSRDGCSWKTGGIARVGGTVYLVVARQLHRCSTDQRRGLQPSFDATIVRSTDDGRTWTNPWGRHDRGGAAPRFVRRTGHFRAMFERQRFSAPFFVQYGPGNTNTVDDADRFLYAVSTDGYAYDGNFLRLGRVPLNHVQDRAAWRFYHVRTTQAGRRQGYWGAHLNGAAHVLSAKHGISQPAVQYVPALHRYLLLSFRYRFSPDFPTRATTPTSRFSFYQARHPWGPWRRFLDRPTQRSLWCGTHCTRSSTNQFGFYDPALVQKFVFDRPLHHQTILTTGDFINTAPRWTSVRLNRLRALPLRLSP